MRMSAIPFSNCPNCLCSQPVTAAHCGVCGHDLLGKMPFMFRLRAFWNRTSWVAVLLFLGTLGFISTMVPAPYSPLYWVKRAIYTPTAECRDGIYSFSSTRGGTCSNHKGVRRWVYTPEQRERDEAEVANEGDVPHPME